MREGHILVIRIITFSRLPGYLEVALQRRIPLPFRQLPNRIIILTNYSNSTIQSTDSTSPLTPYLVRTANLQKWNSRISISADVGSDLRNVLIFSFEYCHVLPFLLIMLVIFRTRNFYRLCWSPCVAAEADEHTTITMLLHTLHTREKGLNLFIH